MTVGATRTNETPQTKREQCEQWDTDFFHRLMGKLIYLSATECFFLEPCPCWGGVGLAAQHPLSGPLRTWTLAKGAIEAEDGRKERNLKRNRVSILIFQLTLDPRYHRQSKTAWIHHA